MDNDEKDAGRVFAIPDLWGPSRWLEITQEPSGLLFSQLKLDNIDERLPDIVEQPQTKDPFFSIPDLSFGPSDELPTPLQSPDPIVDQLPILEQESEDNDMWLFPGDPTLQVAGYQSWDNFNDERTEEPYTAYITEAGASIFDAAVSADLDYLHVGNRGNPIVDSKIYTASLSCLGLGRNSTLFSWDEEKQSFVPTLPEMRISGYTSETLNGLIAVFMECGNTTRFLQEFVDRAYNKGRSPGQVALADAVATLLTIVQSRLSESVAKHRSILQLQVLFQPAHSILTCFQRIVKNTARTRSDESLLSTVFEEIQLLEHRTDSLRDILIEILSRVSHPWLEFVGEWLGLQREVGLPLTKQGEGKSFVSVTDREWINDQGIELQERDFVLNYDKMPSFIAPEDARAIFEVGRSLRFLRSHHSDHPLSRADVIASANPPTFEWKFSWQDIIAVEAKALQYEKDLTIAIRSFSKNASQSCVPDLGKFPDQEQSELKFFGKLEEEMQAHVLASIAAFNLPLTENKTLDRLSMVLNTYLTSAGEISKVEDSLFSPPISLTPLLAFNPLIAAQARVVNGTCMRMFFNSHKLREHLALQRNFHLLGNGVFSSRLSHALFDPELESAERHRGVARSGGIMGLRLGGRDSWPPASSELRLALMGVLTESYIAKQPLAQSQGAGYLEKSLPGGLSFAVRDMSEEEIEKCMNANSIEALDFLRLSYKPPPPLEAVITPMILFKYDQLFKLLLRALRMLYVVSALFRDATDRTSYWQGIDYVAQRFRIEAHHFVSSVCGYFFDTGIEATWIIFERKLDEIEARINIDDDNITLGQNEGLDKLRDYHERVLDRIMFALLLRKRQQPVMQLLEEIFTLILQFSKHSRERALGEKRKFGADNEVREIYLRFRKKVGVFITVCRGLSEKKGYGERRTMDHRRAGQGGLFDGDDLAEENTIAHLLARLEISNYYSRTVSI